MTFDQWWASIKKHVWFFDCEKGTRDLCRQAWRYSRLQTLGEISAIVSEKTEEWAQGVVEDEEKVQTQQGEGRDQEPS